MWLFVQLMMVRLPKTVPSDKTNHMETKQISKQICLKTKVKGMKYVSNLPLNSTCSCIVPKVEIKRAVGKAKNKTKKTTTKK